MKRTLSLIAVLSSCAFLPEAWGQDPDAALRAGLAGRIDASLREKASRDAVGNRLRQLQAFRVQQSRAGGGSASGALVVQHLAADFSLDPATGEYSAKVVARFANGTTRDVEAESFWFPPDLRLRRVRAGSRELPFTVQPRPAWGLTEVGIVFAPPVGSDDVLEVEFDYSGTVRCTSDNLLDIKSCVLSKDYTIFTGVMVLPYFEEDCESDLSITYPWGQEATLNGTLTEQVLLADGRVRRTFHNDRFGARFLMAVGDFEVDRRFLDGVAIASFTRPVDGPYREAWHRIVADILGDYSRRYSPYAFDKLDYVGTSSDLGFGGMAGPGLLFMADYNFQVDPRQFPSIADTFAHELAHQWFAYKFNTADWRGPWVCEGVTEYTSAVWTGAELTRFYGRDLRSTYFRHYNDAYVYRVPSELDEALTGDVYADPNLDPELYVYLAYVKGPLVTNTLAQLMGGWDQFAQAARRWGEAHAFEPYDTEGFRTWLEADSGVDLFEAFEAWVYGKGYPTYTAEVVDGTGEGGGTATVRLSRDKVFPAVHEVVFTDVRGKSQRVGVDFGNKSAATVSATLEAPLASAQFDPNGKLLRRLKRSPAADVNGNGRIDGGDVLAIAWGQGARWDDRTARHWYVDADVDYDGVIGEADLALALEHFGEQNR